tara:strand:+ start:18453 stop:19283 length:831 start_codon:yes stop_codon:yes gene_type:complete
LSETKVISAAQFVHPLVFVRDVCDGLKRHHVWRAFAWDETKLRYHRSVLGLFWIIASYALFVGGISLFFSGFASLSAQEFTIYVALGYATFTFLMANIADGSAVFSTSSAWIKSTNLPYSIYVFKSLFRSLLPFVMQLTVAFALMLYFGTFAKVSWHAFMALPALVMFLLCAVPLQYALGLISARYDDIQHSINAITRLLIFITPILWVREEAHGTRGLLADLNPMTHFLEIFRNPLMGMDARPLSWMVVIGVTILMWLFAGLISTLMRQRLPFWI